MSNKNISMNRTYPKSSHASNTNTSGKLTMLDACNNEFIFIKQADNSIKFEYKPMQPLYSSSGTYSVGTAVFRYLQVAEWTKVIDAFHRAKRQSKEDEQRMMGTLLLKHQSGGTVDSCIIQLFTEIGEELTTLFHAYKE